MPPDNDASLKAALDAIEQRINDRAEPKELEPELRGLVEQIAEDSPLRPRALRLRGIVLNRLRNPKRALEHLHQARRAAIVQQNFAEVVQAGREIALVHSWRGEDLDAALALLRAIALGYLGEGQNDTAIALALAEAGRIELEARRFEEAARLFRLLADKVPQPLDAFQVARIKINLCQALNRMGRHDEVLPLTNDLLADLAKGAQEKASRLSFLTLLEQARAHAGLGKQSEAAESLERARALLPADRNEFEHDEFKETEAELKLARADSSAIDDLKRLAKRYADPSLTVRTANLRMLAARVLFKTGKADEAAKLLAEALRDAIKAGLPDLAQRIRAEMLEGDGARHLDAVLKETGAIESIGGEWSATRQLIRVETLGEGGADKVYRAIDLRDGQEVAVKEISLAGFGEEERQKIIGTVRNEYAVAVTLRDSPRIAKVRGLLSDPAGALYIVQDLVKGTSLTALYTPQPQPAKLLPLLADVGEALSILHASRIVHRDLKPDNVMVRRGRDRDEAVLVDFGIALIDGEQDLLKRFGTPPYMAPEQERGEAVDAGADIYAFGRMIAKVWGGDSKAMPKPLGAIAAKMLEDSPRKRPLLADVRAALAACCSPQT